jgi:hypothetical protein
MSLPGDKKHITISLSDPTLTRYGDAIYDPTFLAIALDPLVSEKEKLKSIERCVFEAETKGVAGWVEG